MLRLYHARRGDHERALRWIVEARISCVRTSDTWTGTLGAIVLTEAEMRAALGDPTGADAAGRDLIELAAGAHPDGHPPGGLAIFSAAPRNSHETRLVHL